MLVHLPRLEQFQSGTNEGSKRSTISDRKDGRHFAHEVGNFVEEGQSLPDAIEAATKRWMVPANKNASFLHIPDGVTYLMACVVEHARPKPTPNAHGGAA